MLPIIPAALATLDPDATTPAFVSFFAGARFFCEPQEGGGVSAIGRADQATRLLLGEGGVDVVQANDGNDYIQGAGGPDLMFGSAGDDIVRDDAGDDVLVGQEGSDLAIGGEGVDIFEFFADQLAAGEFDAILDFEEDADQIVVVGSADVTYDAATGLVSVDGVALVEVAPDLDVEVVTRGETAAIAGAATLPGELADPMATAADAALATDGALLV